jgi:hypothetical protein
MPFRGPPRPGVSQALAAEVDPLRSGHANWPGVHVVGQAPTAARHEVPQYPPLVGQVKVMASRSGGSTYRSRSPGAYGAAPDSLRSTMPAASLSTMSENTESVSMSSITPVISSNTNPCNADQNSSAA